MDTDSTACSIILKHTFSAEDTYIDIKQRTLNFATSTNLIVSSNKQRALLKFPEIRNNLLQQVYDYFQDSTFKPQIVNASLQLFIRGMVTPSLGWQEDNEIAVHDVENFCPSTVTWDCSDFDDGSCDPWRMTALYPKVAADYNTVPAAVASITPRLQGWLSFNMTDDFTNFFNNSMSHSATWMMKKVCEKDYGYISFWSCEGGKCPQLIVYSNTNCYLPPLTPLPEECDHITK